LQLNAVPDFLPCREKERNYITDYLINGIHNGGSSSSLYISGMPGTGKTATTLEIIKRFRTTDFMRENKLRKFDFIHINAMSLSNPNLVYTVLHERITGKRTNPTSSAAFLDEFFKKKDKYKVLTERVAKTARSTKAQQKRLREEADKLRIVLVDELDALVTKKQTLLYNLFDWPCHAQSKLLVIAIANTMDLPEKLQ
jgi:origin recognition complex subunit 1